MDSSSARDQVHGHNPVLIGLSGFGGAPAIGWPVSGAGASRPAPPAACHGAEVVPLSSGPTGIMPSPLPCPIVRLSACLPTN